MDNIKKNILIIDSVLLAGAFISLFLLIGYSQPLAVAPLSSEQNNLLFTIPINNYVLIDDNSDFDSPQTLFIGETLYLESGRYFLKFFDGTRSEIREISFELDVEIQLRRIGSQNLGFFNIGETDLLVDTYDTGSLVDSNLAYSGGIDE